MQPRILAVMAMTATIVLVVAGTVATGVHAQGRTPAGGQGNLNLGYGTGEAKGYAFLLPVAPTSGRPHEISVDLRPDSTLPPPEQWTWHVDTPPNQLKSMLTTTWYAQASCPDALTLLQVTGPGGVLTQNPLHNPIWGNFKTQTFTVDTIVGVCTEWANANQCALGDPGCDTEETFSLVGGVAPASAADRLRLKASCGGGPLPTIDYAPKLSLRCNRVN
jgi:hypothetical protein